MSYRFPTVDRAAALSEAVQSPDNLLSPGWVALLPDAQAVDAVWPRIPALAAPTEPWDAADLERVFFAVAIVGAVGLVVTIDPAARSAPSSGTLLRAARAYGGFALRHVELPGGVQDFLARDGHSVDALARRLCAAPVLTAPLPEPTEADPVSADPGARPTPPDATDSTRAFLSALFTDVSGMIELRPLPVVDRCFAHPTEVPRLLAFIEAHPDNLYVGVATRKDHTSGDLANCLALGAMFSDVDFKMIPEPEARQRLAAFPFPPSLIVRSGHGLHLYWPLREPLDLVTDEPRARALLQRLALHLGGDQSAAECARVLRVPGTWNRKPGLPPVRVELESCEPGRRYNLSELEEWLPALAAPAPGAGFHTAAEPITEGGRHLYLFRAARSLKSKGFSPDAALAALRIENPQRCLPPLPDAEVDRQVASAFAQADRPGFEPTPLAETRPEGDRSDDRRPRLAAPLPDAPNPWLAAMPAPDFLREPEVPGDFLEPRQLARGSITEWFSPRAIGKTLLAHALAAKQARAGRRVLLIDRDNPRREIKRRLAAWGVDDCPTLKVLTRDEAPPLTDRAAWARFPLTDYDIILIDSLDASSEGVGEQDSAKPSKAIASILDVAHAAAGPAILALGNTIKSGAHGRGSGVVEDRADLVFEVRDATGFQPTGTKPWWLELPAAGRADWGASAVRRQRRETYRLAFVPTKFRLGEAPDPYIVELDLRSSPWQYREVTAEVEAEGQAARATAAAERQARMDAAASELQRELARRRATGQPDLGKKSAEALLKEHGLTQKVARQVLRDGWAGTATARAARRWRLVPDAADGRKINVRLPEEEPGATASHDLKSTPPERHADQGDAVAQSQSGQPQLTMQFPASTAGIENAEMRLPPASLPRGLGQPDVMATNPPAGEINRDGAPTQDTDWDSV
jgi:hypothetical protein